MVFHSALCLNDLARARNCVAERGEKVVSGAAQWVEQAVGGGAIPAGLTLARVADERVMGRSGLTLTSDAFRHGGELDPCFTACEEDSVAPPLEWTAPPPGAHELVLVVEDAETGHVHWTVWGLAPQKGKLLEGETPPRTGKNAYGNSEWLLPDPPLGEEHRYVFQLFALDLPLTLMPGATHEELVRNLDGHVTAAAVLTARFEGHEVEEWDEGLDDDD
ncbi:YbhB/YbcL family Raf kinase inhibitor-like protein [Erythrobacter mangrovi]|uniref:YbhB/YbcL family Raf kinase inhibitor-like protein n=1 Tax=Erythrobacter mangrovi TaxID=2739433 RepID=A0A7D3XAC9_9SPHN|nr:YbhB/YbcL family Raf kinase inhibitor-like protein [Erythrobacter mangrovi]QKG70500.1 YbhB/YbcL family Raf kinase inhibitor-like protein [Erythrobacter mangrovi]